MIGAFSDTTLRALKNIPTMKALSPKGLNVMDILYYDQVLIAKDAMTTIGERLEKKKKAFVEKSPAKTAKAPAKKGGKS